MTRLCFLSAVYGTSVAFLDQSPPESMQNKDAFLVYRSQGSPSSLERNCLDGIDRFGPSKVSCARINYVASLIISTPGRSFLVFVWCFCEAKPVRLWKKYVSVPCLALQYATVAASHCQVLSMKQNEKT